MKIFRFDPEVGQEVEQFGSVKAIISKILHLENEAAISSVYIRPNGKFGHHQAVTPQLFLFVQGEGWVRGETDEKLAVREGQAIFSEQGTETGMTAVIIEGIHIDPAELMLPLQENET
jgi:mannose-6-phosphate isomerase-like protein (cupin superfamily)